jgi:hypothetical protein
MPLSPPPFSSLSISIEVGGHFAVFLAAMPPLSVDFPREQAPNLQMPPPSSTNQGSLRNSPRNKNRLPQTDRQTDSFQFYPDCCRFPVGRAAVIDDRRMMEQEQAHSSSGQHQQSSANSQEIISGAQQQQHQQHQQSSQQMQSPMFTFLWPMARGPMMMAAPGGQGGGLQATGDAGAPHAANTWLQEGGSVQ